MKNITKINKYEKLNSSSTTEHKREHNYTLLNQAINIHKSNKRVTKEIEHVGNSNRQRFKGRKMHDRKLNKQKIQLNYNKNCYTEKNKKYKNKGNIIRDKNQLNDNKHNMGQLSMSVLDLLKVFYNTRSDNKILKHSTHTLRITKSNSTNINTIKQSTKHKQQTSQSKISARKRLTKIFNRQPTSIHYLYL